MQNLDERMSSVYIIFFYKVLLKSFSSPHPCVYNGFFSVMSAGGVEFAVGVFRALMSFLFAQKKITKSCLCV